MDADAVVASVAAYQLRHVTVTGGEPLAQPAVASAARAEPAAAVFRKLRRDRVSGDGTSGDRSSDLDIGGSPESY